MAAETKPQKRKGAENAASAAKKRKSEKPAAEPTKTKTTTSKQSKETTKAERPSRKRAADFFDNEEASKVAAAAAVKEPKAKKTKVADGSVAGKSASAKVAKAKAKAAPAAEPEVKAIEAAEEDVWADSEEEDIADQSAALLQGFESSDDEEGDNADAILEVPAIPSDNKLSKQLKAASKDESEGPGVVYVGRVPHGFYEHQMRAYFSQFGEISQLRLSRNKKTGHSKHYAFIEFSSREVAKIVAATMNKYLLFGHILQVRILAPEEIHPELFKGANKRFKAVPRNKIQGRQLRLPKEREIWEKRIANENKRRKEKEEKLKTLGYTYEAPDLASTKAIPFRKQSIEDGGDPDAIADAEIPKALPPSEAKKSKAKQQKETIVALEGSTETKTPAATKAQQKKAKSSKAKKEIAAAV